MTMSLAKACLIVLIALGVSGDPNRQRKYNAPPHEVITHTHEVVTRLPGELPRHWRSMRTAWKVWPGSGDTEDHMQDMALRGNLLYYRCPSEAGCIQTITGRYLWKHSFYAPSSSGMMPPQNYDSWHLVIGDRFVYTVESRIPENTQPPAFHLYALQRNNGRLAWTYALKQSPIGAPCPAEGMVLTPLNDGTVLALNDFTGKVLWRKPIAIAKSRIGSVVLQAAAGNLVAQVGSGRIAAFHLRDGKQVWSYACEGARDDEGDSNGFSIDHHTAYVLLNNNELVALNIADGHRLWSRQTNGTGSPSNAVFVLGDKILSAPFSEPGVVLKRDGKSVARIADPHKFEAVYKSPFVMPWLSDAAPGQKPTQQLFETIDGLQLVNGVPRSLRSQSPAETLVMLDAATGAEQWRWQPEDGVMFEKILSDGHRIYLQDYQSIRAVEEGPVPALPTTPSKRRELARFLVQTASHEFTMFDPKQRRWVSVVNVGNSTIEAPDSSGSTLNLVKLGADSVPAVMEEVHRAVVAEDKHLPDLKELSYTVSFSPSDLSRAMDLLTDIGDRSCVPGLVAELNGAKNPLSRMTIARALIRLGDPRAIPALMQYARTTPNDPNTRLDALALVARAARGTLVNYELTQYLLTALNDTTTPASIRLFARFELLNDRGPEAREAALTAFKYGQPSKLIPDGVVLTSGQSWPSLDGKVQEGFPKQVNIMSTARDASGKIWGAFYSDYIGLSGDLWFAQSNDGTHWTHPLFAMNLNSRCAPSGTPGAVKIRCVGNGMVIRWDEDNREKDNARPSVHVDRLTIEDIERDRDGDGINDLMKLEIGIARHKGDANDKTVPGKEDKNVGTRREPETNEAGIFQAVVEALCQVGRDGEPSTKPVRFGGRAAPLVLPIPPGSQGGSILGHPGPVVFRRFTGQQDFPGFRYSNAGYNFMPPHIDLAGYYHTSTERRLALDAQLQDPYSAINPTTARERQPSFRDYFPCEISADGKRARVGWEQRLGGITDQSEIGFDIEVRKIAGRWYPVECRRICAYGHHWHEEVEVPDKRLFAGSH